MDLTELSQQLTRKNEIVNHLERVYEDECDRYAKLKADHSHALDELRNYKNLVEKMEKQNQMIVDAQVEPDCYTNFRLMTSITLK